MEMSYHLNVVICPNTACNCPIHLSVGNFVGGENDRGGVIIECKNCHTIFPCPLKNPNDASAVVKNGRVLDTWLDELPSFLESKYNIDREMIDGLKISPVFGYEKPPAVPWRPFQDTFYKEGMQNLELHAKAALDQYQKKIKENYKAYFNLYVKGRHTVEKSFVIIDYDLNGKKNKATFAKKIESENDLTIDNLYLIDHSNVDLETQIDGIYTRDQLTVYLERLLNRWRYTAKEVLLVVPFIGFNYKNTEDALYDLWNWLENNVDADKTRLITRKGTFNLFKHAQDNTGIEFNTLVELGLLEPFIEKMTGKDADFFQKSHAKYYVGVYDDHVEVLSGSFNIHQGSSYENMMFKKYSKTFFKERYLHMFKDFDYQEEVEGDEGVHYMTLGVEKPTNYIIELGKLPLSCYR